MDRETEKRDGNISFAAHFQLEIENLVMRLDERRTTTETFGVIEI